MSGSSMDAAVRHYWYLPLLWHFIPEIERPENKNEWCALRIIDPNKLKKQSFEISVYSDPFESISMTYGTIQKTLANFCRKLTNTQHIYFYLNSTYKTQPISTTISNK